MCITPTHSLPKLGLIVNLKLKKFFSNCTSVFQFQDCTHFCLKLHKFLELQILCGERHFKKIVKMSVKTAYL